MCDQFITIIVQCYGAYEMVGVTLTLFDIQQTYLNIANTLQHWQTTNKHYALLKEGLSKTYFKWYNNHNSHALLMTEA